MLLFYLMQESNFLMESFSFRNYNIFLKQYYFANISVVNLRIRHSSLISQPKKEVIKFLLITESGMPHIIRSDINML